MLPHSETTRPLRCSAVVLLPSRCDLYGAESGLLLYVVPTWCQPKGNILTVRNINGKMKLDVNIDSSILPLFKEVRLHADAT